MKKLYFNLLTLITTSLLFPSSVLAQKPGDLFCNDNSGIATAIGCVSLQPSDFAGDILRFSVGIGGGIALLRLLFIDGVYALEGSNDVRAEGFPVAHRFRREEAPA